MALVDYLFYGILLFMCLEYFWELYLSLRQQKVYQNTVKVPSELKDIISKETYEKARVYGLDRNVYAIFKDTYSIVTTVIFLSLNGLKFFWDLGGSLLITLNLENGEILHSAAFLLIMNTFNAITAIPFNVYETFVIEERHGFNNQTASFYIKDKIKSYIVSNVIMLPLTCAIIYIVQIGGDYFFIFLWLFAVATTFFLLTIYPDYIAPLFDKYAPLPDGELKTRIEQLAASVSFPLYKLYIVEGSKRSVHSNAYFYGFFKNKRIVLFDTLLKDYAPNTKNNDSKKNENEEPKGCDNEEVLAVLGHELGHWKLNHVTKNIIIIQINIFLLFFTFGLLYKHDLLYNAFGFYDEKPIIIGLLSVLQFIFQPYNSILTFFLTSLSRRFEFQADAFAERMGKAVYLKRALIKLNRDNLGFPVFDWLYSMWHHSHPPLLERLEAIDKSK